LKSLSITILLMLSASMAFTSWPEYSTAQTPIVLQPQQSKPPLAFKQISLAVKMVNATYAEFTLSAYISNPSNRTLEYVIEVSASTGYTPYYLFTPSFPPAELVELGVEITSEKYGKLNVTVDRSAASAFSSIEAEGYDRVRLDGWMVLRQSRRLIWREYVEDYVSFSFRPALYYEGPALPSEKDLEVTFSYPAEYTRTDEANYKVMIIDGYKLIRYSERFYGGYGLSFNLYKRRIPVSSLIVFSALWILLIAVVLTIRRIHVKDQRDTGK